MASWSTRRRRVIGLSALGLILILAAGVYLVIFYKAPTCSDGIKNGRELDIDCGGKCVRLCQSAYLPAQIAWGGGKFEKITDGTYNVAAYIINPNTSAAAVAVPYKFTLYDSRGILIIERTGKIDIPAHRNTLAFESGVKVGQRIPTKATFEFVEQPVWFKAEDSLDGLVIGEKDYRETDTGSSLFVALSNKTLVPYRDILVNVVLYNSENNAIGFSRTRVDIIRPSGQLQYNDGASFTWPFSRKGEVVSVEVLPSKVR